MRFRRMSATLAGAALVVSGLAVAAPASAAPATTTGATTALAATSSGGWNDFSCRPSAAHPHPVVLLHGLGGSGTTNWLFHAPILKSKGYCVFSFTYGKGILGGLAGGFTSMRTSAGEVSAFVDRVLAATGAAEVDLVGHSEGTTVGAYYLKARGGAAKVSSFVGFGSNFAGTTLLGLDRLINAVRPALPRTERLFLDNCAACLEFIAPNAFLDELNAGGVTVPGVTYTSIISRYDLIVTPYTNGALSGPNATTIVLQDACFFNPTGHLAMAFSPDVATLIERALDPVAASRPLRC